VVAIPLYDAERNCTIHLVVESSDKQTASLLDYLKTYLPSYMMPKQIHFMDKFPLNASNKIDRKLIATTIH
jgi:D-alanine--poly(phosphoribitol) ligase subunit 1